MSFRLLTMAPAPALIATRVLSAEPYGDTIVMGPLPFDRLDGPSAILSKEDAEQGITRNNQQWSVQRSR
jgi:hypothetical protein